MVLIIYIDTMTYLRIQYLSNLFLQKTTINSIPRIKKVAPILALCGNIGSITCPNTKKFIKEVDKYYERVFWIPGMLEYSSQEGKTWIEQSNLYYDTLKSWNLKRTTFCQKYEFSINNTFTILATPLWHSTFAKKGYTIYEHTFGYNNIMNKNDFMRVNQNEMVWLQKQCRISPTKKILLSYSPLEMGKMDKSNVICHLYGTENGETPLSYTGGRNPWCGLNMYSSKNYLQNAFIELKNEPSKYL